MPRTGFAYVSIVDWPEGFTRDDMVRAVVMATGMDPFLAGQRVAKPPPMVLLRIEDSIVSTVLDIFHQGGVTAFAPTDSQLQTVSPPARAKRFHRAEGSRDAMYMVEVWRGEPVGFRALDLFLIVRARLAKTERTQTEQHSAVYSEPITGTFYVESESVKTQRTQVCDIMDLYLTDGRRIRVSGDKFNFDVLGKDRGHSDNINADRLALRLASQAPRALVDTAFGQFNVPAGVIPRGALRTSSDGSSRRDDHPVFDFYSVWACLRYRRMLGG